MVSKARLDLPEPERPVTTMSLSRGISTEMFLRLCTRAPCTAIVVRCETDRAACRGLELIRRFPHEGERQLLHQHVAPFRELEGYRGLSDESPVGQVLASRRHPFDVVVPFEVSLNLGCRSCFAHLAQVIEQRTEQRRRPLRHVTIDCLERGLYVLSRLL